MPHKHLSVVGQNRIKCSRSGSTILPLFGIVYDVIRWSLSELKRDF